MFVNSCIFSQIEYEMGRESLPTYNIHLKPHKPTKPKIQVSYNFSV